MKWHCLRNEPWCKGEGNGLKADFFAVPIDEQRARQFLGVFVFGMQEAEMQALLAKVAAPKGGYKGTPQMIRKTHLVHGVDYKENQTRQRLSRLLCRNVKSRRPASRPKLQKYRQQPRHHRHLRL